jgi:hypothetical protein
LQSFFVKDCFLYNSVWFIEINVRSLLFRSLLIKLAHADVAQLVEQLICNQLVGGSSPSIGSEATINRGSIIGSGEIPERSNGADCKSVGEAFGGSNPPLPTLRSAKPDFRMTNKIVNRKSNYS